MLTGTANSIADLEPPTRPPDRLFLGFLEAAPDAVVIIDGNGVIVQVNSQTEKLFGYRREELVGRPLEVLMPERYRGPHIGHRQVFSVNPLPQTMGRGLELFGLRKDGSEFPVDVSLSPLPPEAGVLVASTIRDMSAHRRLEDDLRRQTRELEEADRQKDHFMAAFAHEFRSPLGVLTNLAQLLRLPQASATVQQRAVDSLGRQVTHMSRLVEDLLDVSLVRRGKIALCWEAVDLATVLSNAVELSQPLVEARKHHLEVTQFPEPLWVRGDLSRLVQVISNLLSNAAKYTPEGGHIRLSAAREDGATAIHVRDNGVGIPMEMLSQVFDLFVQVESASGSRAGGLGLGLTLVRRLVELHGGTVHVTSDGPGQGSVFVVRLPSLLDRPNAAPAACSTP